MLLEIDSLSLIILRKGDIYYEKNEKWLIGCDDSFYSMLSYRMWRQRKQK